MMTLEPHAPILVLAAFLAPPAVAQEVLVEIHGEDHWADAGHTVAFAGDVDADGVPDFMDAWYEQLDCEDVGMVDVRSGADGHLILRLPGDENTFGRGLAAAGDVDGDGHADVAVAAPYAREEVESGWVRVYSGADGAILRELVGEEGDGGFGVALVGGVDLDGDAIPDLVLGIFHLGTSLSGLVRAYAGSDGTVLWEQASVLQDGIGRDLDVVGDLDGDGVPELIVGGEGRFLVLHGADGSVRYDLEGIGRLGRTVAGIGDWTGDGVPDFAAAAPLWGDGRVRVYSGANGVLVKQIVAPEDEHIAGWVAGLGDIDGNGRADLITGGSGGHAHLFGGPEGELIGRTPRGISILGTQAAAGFPDLDGDGVPEILLGLHGRGGGITSGGVRIHSGRSDCDGNGRSDWLDLVDGTHQDCDGDGTPDACEGLADCWPCEAEGYCEATTTSSGFSAVTSVTGSYRLSEGHLKLSALLCPPNQAGIFFFGTAPQQVPLGDGWLCVVPPLNRFPLSPTDACGFASREVDVSVAPGSLLQVGTWYFQYWFRDGGSSNLARASRLTLCP